jgi:glyoxylase-like metal-dependent hydrolase (beta-lactamase superfamily II)
MTGRGTNTYVLGHGDAVVVIDPGPADAGHARNIETAVRARGHAAIVLLTHHHVDHSEAAVEVARRLDAPLAAIPHELAPPLDRRLTDHDQLDLGADTLEVLATPGHCRDHACFEWKQARAIFAGDLVAGEGFIVIDPPEGDMRGYLASLALVRDRRFGTHPTGAAAAAVLLPGHGPAIENPVEYLDGYIAHRLAREAKVHAALDGRGQTLAELLALAYDDTPEAMHPVAARSLQAHLDKLVADGRAANEGGGYRRLG